MEKQKLTKKDLKSPDVFIAQMSRLGEWAFDNRLAIIAAMIAVAAGAVIWAAIGMYTAHQEEMAQESLFGAEKKMQQADDSFKAPLPKKPDAKGNPDQTPETPKATRTGQIELDYKEALPSLKDVTAKYPSTQASVVASLDLAHLYYDYKKYDDEIGVLQGVVSKARHPMTKAMVLDNLGLAFEAKGDCNKAIEQWNQISENKNENAFLGKSLINSALCYEKLNQPDKALVNYEKFDNAEKEIGTLTKALAAEYGLNPNAPMEQQAPAQVQKYQQALNRSERYQELGTLLSDQDSVKAARKYMKLLKRGQS